MRDHEAEFAAEGVNLAAIGLGDLRYAQSFREESGIGFPLLVDARRQAYRVAELKSGPVLDLVNRKNAKSFRRARKAGHSQHRLGKNPFQLGGSFVFGAGGEALFSHVSETFGDNAEIADLLAAASN